MMDKSMRAKQFLPFDSLKGLKEAIFLKDYEHERIAKKDISIDDLNLISENMMKTDKNSIVKIKYYNDGYYHEIIGNVKINIYDKFIKINGLKIEFDNIYLYEILNK